MCLIVIPRKPVIGLCTAAAAVQTLLDDGTLAAALGKSDPDATQRAVAAFDIMSDNVGRVLGEYKEVSPFLRYRQEFFSQYDTARRLRALVLNLWGGRPVNLSELFQHADERHTRIALDCIASYTRFGENDTFFMTLAAEIVEMEQGEVDA